MRGVTAVQPSQRRPSSSSASGFGGGLGCWLFLGPAHEGLNARLQVFHCEVDHRRGVERQELAQQQAADYGNAKRNA